MDPEPIQKSEWTKPGILKLYMPFESPSNLFLITESRIMAYLLSLKLLRSETRSFSLAFDLVGPLSGL